MLCFKFLYVLWKIKRSAFGYDRTFDLIRMDTKSDRIFGVRSGSSRANVRSEFDMRTNMKNYTSGETEGGCCFRLKPSPKPNFSLETSGGSEQLPYFVRPKADRMSIRSDLPSFESHLNPALGSLLVW